MSDFSWVTGRDNVRFYHPSNERERYLILMQQSAAPNWPTHLAAQGMPVNPYTPEALNTWTDPTPPGIYWERVRGNEWRVTVRRAV